MIFCHSHRSFPYSAITEKNFLLQQRGANTEITLLDNMQKVRDLETLNPKWN